jgi:predicted AAA+ superfamily ATPase
VIEDLIRREQLSRPYTQFFFWRTATGHEADLIMDRGNERIAIEVKSNSGTNPHDARRLEGVLDDIGATRGYLLGMGAPSEKISPRVSNISLDTDPSWMPD